MNLYQCLGFKDLRAFDRAQLRKGRIVIKFGERLMEWLMRLLARNKNIENEREM